MSKAEEIEAIRNEMCDKYCRYPYEYNEEEEGIPLSDSEICKSCPLNRLEALYGLPNNILGAGTEPMC